MSFARGLIKTAVGVTAFYFVVMRNLEPMADWYNDRYIERAHEKQLLRSLAQEKRAILAEQQDS